MEYAVHGETFEDLVENIVMDAVSLLEDYGIYPIIEYPYGKASLHYMLIADDMGYPSVKFFTHENYRGYLKYVGFVLDLAAHVAANKPLRIHSNYWVHHALKFVDTIDDGESTAGSVLPEQLRECCDKTETLSPFIEAVSPFDKFIHSGGYYDTKNIE